MAFTFEAVDLLAEAVRKNQAIHRIDLSCNDLHDDFGDLVAKFVQS